jgi:hypothetical protein
MALLKQSTAYARTFLMVQSSDHVTGLTGASVSVALSKAGAAFAAAAGAVSEIGNGFYKVALTTTDTGTLGDLAFHCTAAGADPTDFVDQIAANILGDTLPANVAQWNGSAVAAPASAGIPDVNVKNMNNIAASAVTTINANLGTVQPLNFTGTGAGALVKGDTVDIAGVAAALDANNLLKVDVEDVNGAASIETGITLKQSLQYMAAALAGVLSGAATTTIAIAAIGNAATPRISATVDASGNRSAITLS